MKIEPGVAEMRYAVAEFVKRSGAAAQGRSDFKAFAKIESFQSGLSCKMRKRPAKITHEAAEIAAQRGDGNVIANVERGELLGKVIPVGVREHPLREIVRKALGQEVMAAECLISVMEDGSVAAILKPGQ
jgi:hypothetical protein